MRLFSHLQAAKEIIHQYKGGLPFSAWLKDFFRQHKKFGSKDRKQIGDLCFCYFRLGRAFETFTVEERLLIAQALCHTDSEFVAHYKPEWKAMLSLPVAEKLNALDSSQGGLFFPLSGEVSTEIDLEKFCLSFLQQPDLFLRIRPGKHKIVLEKLQHAGIGFSLEGEHCVRLPNTTKIDEIIRLDEEAVVQDISSQQVLKPLLQHQTPNRKSQTSFWDCCAASGGKTILVYDAFQGAQITASDIRESILLNLRNRLKRAGILSCKSFVADVSAAGFSLPQKFDVVICDAPCSGSGTWARTPEQTVFFNPEKIEHYAALQKKIARNASKSLRPKGAFLYITCSVFKKENEDVVQYLQEEGLQILSQQYFKGYDKKGDTLFAALFTTS